MKVLKGILTVICGLAMTACALFVILVLLATGMHYLMPGKTLVKNDKMVQQESNNVPDYKKMNESPLTQAKFKTDQVVSGGENDIGDYGYISISKTQLKNITSEQLFEFAKMRVEGSGLNYVSVKCDDGTGICFSGSDIQIPTYGTINEDGALDESVGMLRLRNGVYEYEPSAK